MNENSNKHDGLSMVVKNSMVNDRSSIDSMKNKVQSYLREINKRIPYQGFLIYRNPTSKISIEQPEQKFKSKEERPTIQSISLGEKFGSKIFSRPTTLSVAQMIHDNEYEIKPNNNITIDNKPEKIRNNLKNYFHTTTKRPECSSAPSSYSNVESTTPTMATTVPKTKISNDFAENSYKFAVNYKK